MDEKAFNDLRQRLGDEHLGKRKRAQVDHILSLTGQGLGTFHFENMTWFFRSVDIALRLSGVIKLGQHNALQFVVREIACLSPG